MTNKQNNAIKRVIKRAAKIAPKFANLYYDNAYYYAIDGHQIVRFSKDFKSEEYKKEPVIPGMKVFGFDKYNRNGIMVDLEECGYTVDTLKKRYKELKQDHKKDNEYIFVVYYEGEERYFNVEFLINAMESTNSSELYLDHGIKSFVAMHGNDVDFMFLPIKSAKIIKKSKYKKDGYIGFLLDAELK